MKGEQSLKEIKTKSIKELNILISPSIKGFVIDNRISNEIINFNNMLNKLGAKSIIKIMKLESNLITKTYKTFFDINSNKLGAEDFSKCEEDQMTIQNQQNKILNDYDCWILPVCSTLAIKHNKEKSDIKINNKSVNYWKALGQYCIPFSVSGFPVVTLPIGMLKGLPLGVQIVTRQKEELGLLSIAKTIEKNLGQVIKSPKFVN